MNPIDGAVRGPHARAASVFRVVPPVLPPMPVRGWMRWPLPLFDEIDYGVVLVDGRASVLHANRVAEARLAAGDPLAVENNVLRCADAADHALLEAAIAGAARSGLRRLLSVGRGEAAVEIAVVPLAAEPEHAEEPASVLLLLSRARLCEPLSAQWFARCHGLTPAEARVLEALCKGRRPAEIAASFGVAMSTVRTQIATVRAKTAAPSIAELVQRVAQLPPMMNALRGGGGCDRRSVN